MSVSDLQLKFVLGPTNTGKTFYAVDRMMGYASGMVGFPLRLLARENYDKMVAKLGASRVALITGEEKIIPPNASYFCCTVEAMPLTALSYDSYSPMQSLSTGNGYRAYLMRGIKRLAVCRAVLPLWRFPPLRCIAWLN
jgi:hypothetical protein